MIYQYIYVIGPLTGPFKVGITNDVGKRLSMLQVGNHLKLQLLKTYRVREEENIKYWEGRVHGILRPHHVRGEWFQCQLAYIEEKIEATLGNALLPVQAVEIMNHPLSLATFASLDVRTIEVNARERDGVIIRRPKHKYKIPRLVNAKT